MKDARRLVRALCDPASVTGLPAEQWTDLIAMGRAESLAGSLAHRLERMDVPPRVATLLDAARADAAQARTQALWEAEMARRALAPTGVPVILLKGTAYAAAGLQASVGRSIGDLDILVPRASLGVVQEALLAAGWEWVKEDAYDDLYYRRWMHELPPLIHRERDRMIDVHHTILPLTARPTPDAAVMIADSVVLPGTGRGTMRSMVEGAPRPTVRIEGPLHQPPAGPPPRTGKDGLRVLSPPDMIVHAAAHLFADGDLAGGLRNLWDIDRLLREFADEADFWPSLTARAERHELSAAVARAVRIAHELYATPIPGSWRTGSGFDALFKRRLLARDGWGRERRKGLRLAFYVRSHWLRMPPLMLARHLWIKARR